MAATNYTLLVARVRSLGSDTATSNFRPAETPTGRRDAANRVFRLAYPNPISASIYLTYGASVIRQPVGVSTFSILDGPSGYIQMATAPDANTTQPFFFDYFHNWFLDADYESMIDEAGEELQVPAGTDPGENFYPTVTYLALERYWLRRASQFAMLYQSQGGGASSNPEEVTKSYLALAKQARASAEKMRLAATVPPEQKQNPASGTITYGMSPYTPKR